ncbi:DMT family protein [Caulobacter sp. 17J80-11]|uniref:DMT family protein n=1 Tax=Caulobacter sp. 17J80-11 TaxID=2763502 RepID=UPI001653BE9F|nr:DMT family protein [Caulobacter sp. 17J80-11]
MKTILLLFASNIFMTFAWYGHLKFTSKPLWIVVIASWAIAFIEYWFAVPANRIGYTSGFSVGQLKVMQEVITLLVFAVFAVWIMGEPLKWNHAAAFVCLVGAVGFIFADKF